MDRAQNLAGPAPHTWLTLFQISSKSVHFRQSYCRTRKDHLCPIEYLQYRLFWPIITERTRDDRTTSIHCTSTSSPPSAATLSSDHYNQLHHHYYNHPTKRSQDYNGPWQKETVQSCKQNIKRNSAEGALNEDCDACWQCGIKCHIMSRCDDVSQDSEVAQTSLLLHRSTLSIHTNAWLHYRSGYGTNDNKTIASVTYSQQVSSLLSGWNICWPRYMLPPGESRWACRRDRQTDARLLH